MKKQIITPALISFTSVLAVAGAPLAVLAASAPPPGQAPLLITEVQTGSPASASEEFIELYNTSPLPIDLAAHAWQLEIASSTAVAWSAPLRTIDLSGTVAPGHSYVVASQFSSNGQTVQYMPEQAQAWFHAGLSAAGGHVRLTYHTNQPQADATCSAVQTVVDEVEWSAPHNDGPAIGSLDGRSVFTTPQTSGVPAGSSIQRLLDPHTLSYVDSDTDANDFALSSPSPAVYNTQTVLVDRVGTPQPAVPPPTDTCDPRPPAPPGTSGSTAPPVDPPPTDPGNGGDSADDPPAAPRLPATDEGLLPPQISELLPNPAPPHADATDEFIELYNPNDTAYELSGFRLQAGTTATHDYTFPDGTLLAPHAFQAFFAADTGLSLSNSGGQVRLIDPLGTLLAQSDIYGTAKDGQAWALINGTWQWSATATPNAANTLAGVATATKPATTPAVKKTAAVKAAATTKPKAPKKATSKTAPPAEPTPVAGTLPAAPLHPAILAGIAILAVLYGAYEYRYDMANYLRRFRDNRAARRKNRRTAARR